MAQFTYRFVFFLLLVGFFVVVTKILSLYRNEDRQHYLVSIPSNGNQTKESKYLDEATPR